MSTAIHGSGIDATRIVSEIESVLPDAVSHRREDQRGNAPEHQRQILANPLAVLDFVRGRGAGDQDGPAVVIETQLWALFHISTVPHSSSAVRVGFLTGKMDGMRTQTIERTDTDERVDDGTDSDTPKFFHYVKKDKIAESAVMGTHVVALCGEVFPVTKAAKPGSPVCPDCKKIYEKLKK